MTGAANETRRHGHFVWACSAPGQAKLATGHRARTDSKIETVIVTAPSLIPTPGSRPTPSRMILLNPLPHRRCCATALRAGRSPSVRILKGWLRNMRQNGDGRRGFAPSRVKAGAPMKEKGCQPNCSVIFTPQPQAYSWTRSMRRTWMCWAITARPRSAIPSRPGMWLRASTDNRGRNELYLDEDGDYREPLPQPCGGCVSPLALH